MSHPPTHTPPPALHHDHPRSLLRPYKAPGLFITAIGSDIGKTTVTSALAAAFHQLHVRVAICKPLATGCPAANYPSSTSSHDNFLCPDAALSAKAAGLDPNDPSLLRYLAPLRFATPVSPALASKTENRPVEWRRVAAALDFWQENAEVLLVEGAGGWYVPCDSHNFMIADIASALRLPVIVVTTPELGTLNQTLLTVHAIRERNLAVAGLVINRVPPEDKRDLAIRSNLEELPLLTGVPVRAILPELPTPIPDPIPTSFINALKPFAHNWWTLLRPHT
jgi:dethiobiotin synthetase